MKIQQAASMALMAAIGTQALAAERDIQFISIDAQTRVVTLMNTGSESVDLNGWRFCTQNTSEVRRYTSPSALAGVVLAPGGELAIHFNDDANPKNPNEFNAAAMGRFAPFELEAFGLSFYFPNAQGNVSFSNGNFIADHLQWSINGIDNTTADERADEAEAGGVWTDQSLWISTQPDTVRIELNDSTFAVLHGPSDYTVIGSCVADLNGDGVLNFFDVSAFLSAFGSSDLAADFTGDGALNFFDVSAFLSAFSSGCP